MQRRVLTGKQSRLTAEERQQRVADAQHTRDAYEDAHLGGFEKIYPLEGEEDPFA